MEELIVGSHVSMSKASNYLTGAVQSAIGFGANTFMIYTGAPQNTTRVDLSLMNIKQGLTYLQTTSIQRMHLVVHAPYVINLATFKFANRQYAVNFLIEEIRRVSEMEINYLVLHPGSYVGQKLEASLVNLVNSLQMVLSATEESGVIICLETMAGKGCEIGSRFEELAYLIKGCNNHPRLAVCLDTCHLHDAGYDLSDKEQVLNQLDAIIGFHLVKVIHLNDSCNQIGARKDRHANLGYGMIGFQTLLAWAYEPIFKNVPKILETPYYSVINSTGKKESISPYKDEISILKAKKWFDFIPKDAIFATNRKSLSCC